MQNIRDLLTELTDINMNNVSDQIVVTMAIIVGLLVVASFFSLLYPSTSLLHTPNTTARKTPAEKRLRSSTTGS